MDEGDPYKCIPELVSHCLCPENEVNAEDTDARDRASSGAEDSEEDDDGEDAGNDRMDTENLTKTEINRMTCPEIRKKLKELGETVTGKKADLVARLCDAQGSTRDASSDEDSAEESDDEARKEPRHSRPKPRSQSRQRSQSHGRSRSRSRPRATI